MMEKDYILHKWLNGEASAQEIEQLKASKEYEDYLKISASASRLEVPEVNSEANYRIIRSKLDRPGTLSEENKTRKLPIKSIIYSVAAVLVVVFMSYIFLGTLNDTVSTDIAQKENYSLPDGSEFILNSSSTLTYNKKNWNKERALELEGEAFFKVSKGSKFTVETALGTVAVLGTQFNVYARDNAFKIECFEGLVSVAFNDTIIKLPQGTRLQIEDGNLLDHDNFKASSPSWTANESSFTNASLSSVLEELKRQYPIKLTAKFSNTNRRFTGSFTHSDLDLALKSICEPLQLAFTIEGESVTIYAKEPK
tara:strand:- start:32390 stop:33319 length:930 start_codon:yes stop_codon:yes gene_type:complete